MGELAELGLADTETEAAIVALLQLERADQRDEVGVAAALAEPVQRTLDLAGAGLDRGE